MPVPLSMLMVSRGSTYTRSKGLLGACTPKRFAGGRGSQLADALQCETCYASRTKPCRAEYPDQPASPRLGTGVLAFHRSTSRHVSHAARAQSTSTSTHCVPVRQQAFEAQQHCHRLQPEQRPSCMTACLMGRWQRSPTAWATSILHDNMSQGQAARLTDRGRPMRSWPSTVMSSSALPASGKPPCSSMCRSAATCGVCGCVAALQT